MDVLSKRRVNRALSSADLLDGASPWTIIGVAPSLSVFDARRIKPADAVRVIITQKTHKDRRYHNREGRYVKTIKDDLHSIELSPINTLFGRVRGELFEFRTSQLKMYRRFNPAWMTVPLLLSHFSGDSTLVLQYLRRCIDCLGETEDTPKESDDLGILLKNVQDSLAQPLFDSHNPWNRHDFQRN